MKMVMTTIVDDEYFDDDDGDDGDDVGVDGCHSFGIGQLVESQTMPNRMSLAYW